MVVFFPLLLLLCTQAAHGFPPVLPLQEDLAVGRDVTRILKYSPHLGHAQRLEHRWTTEETSPPVHTTRDRRDALHSFVKEVVECLHLPGLAVSVVNGTDVFWSEGFGHTSASETRKVDEDTLFGIGSTSKAFTAFLAALLVENGTFTWDQRVREILPEFRLFDPTADALVTVRDMFSHRTGLPRHDSSAYNSMWSRYEYVLRTRYLEPTYPIRQQWQYSNVMIGSVGVVVAAAAGKTWEDFVHERIFEPLDMTRSYATYEEAATVDNKAYPMMWNPATEKFEDRDWSLNYVVDFLAPAGGIVSSVADMGKWIVEHLTRQTGLLSAQRIEEMHEPSMTLNPRVLLPPGARLPPALRDYLELQLGVSYGMGWFQGTYRGHRRVFHAGDTMGQQALVNLLPDDGIGFVLLGNAYGGRGSGIWREVVAMYIMDVMLDLDHPLTVEDACTFPCSLFPFLPECEQENDNIQASAEERTMMTRVPSRPPRSQEYTGIYTHPTYGKLEVTSQDSKDEEDPTLVMTMNDFFAGPLKPKIGDELQWDITTCPFCEPGIVAATNSAMFTRNSAGLVVGVKVVVEGDYASGDTYGIPFTNAEYRDVDRPGMCTFPFQMGEEAFHMEDTLNGRDGQDGRDGKDGKSLSAGPLVGIVLGSLALAVIVAGAVSHVVARRRTHILARSSDLVGPEIGSS